VFLPAKDNSRVDLLIQDDETKVPVNLFTDANSEDDNKKNAKYIQTVINTNDHRMMILDDVAKHSNASGYGMDSKDRKSTRLNSSHVSISYAVFCLKKKKE